MSSVRSLRPHQKYAWVLLFVSSALFLLTSVFFIHSFFVMPYVANTGDLSHVLAGSPSIATWMRGIFRDTAIAQLGVGVFGMSIAAVSFRRGERWAWYALWYLPVVFLAYIGSQAELGNSVVPPSVLFIASLLGLLLPFRRFWPKSKSSP